MIFSRQEADKLFMLSIITIAIYVALFISLAFSDKWDYWFDTKCVLLFLLGLIGLTQTLMAWLGVIEVKQ